MTRKIALSGQGDSCFKDHSGVKLMYKKVNPFQTGEFLFQESSGVKLTYKDLLLHIAINRSVSLGEPLFYFARTLV